MCKNVRVSTILRANIHTPIVRKNIFQKKVRNSAENTFIFPFLVGTFLVGSRHFHGWIDKYKCAPTFISVYIQVLKSFFSSKSWIKNAKFFKKYSPKSQYPTNISETAYWKNIMLVSNSVWLFILFINTYVLVHTTLDHIGEYRSFRK